MRSQDLKNIIVNHAPNHHSKNPGWEYFPSSQIKIQVEAAQKKELVKPSPPSIKIKTLELKAKYTDKTKPKHIFKKTDLKIIAKQKRESLQQWITEENNLKKGIQKPHKCKPAPEQKPDEPNDQWPDMNEDQQIPQDDNQQEEEDQYNDNENDNEVSQKQKSIKNDEEQNNEQNDEQNDEQNEDQNQEQNEEQNENQEQIEKIEENEENEENQEEDQYDQDNFDQNENDSQNEVTNQQSMDKIKNSSQQKSNQQSENQINKTKEQIIENKSEVKSEVSNSFVQNQSKMINKSMNTSSVLGYRSQFADQMRSLMEEF